LSSNKNAIELLKENPDKINWNWLSKNENPNAISLLKENQDKINWKALSSNKNAIDLLRDNLDKIDWFYLCLNPNAIEIIKENLDNIRFHCYDLQMLYANASIFELDHNKNNLKLEQINRNLNLALS
jgi:hypothetical protein